LASKSWKPQKFPNINPYIQIQLEVPQIIMISSYKSTGSVEITKKSFKPYPSSFHGLNPLINHSKSTIIYTKLKLIPKQQSPSNGLIKTNLIPF
jgi:hypothetical protein